jgi:hypothetical protein
MCQQHGILAHHFNVLEFFELSIKKNSTVFSPQANYTDRAIAAGQRS